MGSTWFVVECGLYKHPKMAALPNDTARFGWIAVLAEAKQQRQQGTFASEAHFKEVMGRHGRQLKHYLAVGLMERSEAGRLAVHDWKQHQWAGKKAGQREDNSETNEGQNEDPHARERAVSLSVGVTPFSSIGVARDDPEWPAMVWLGEHRASIPEGGGLHRKLIRLCEKHGAQKVIRAMAELGDNLEAGQYVLGADNALNPIPSAPRLSPKDQKAQSIAEVRAEAQRRLAEKAATA